MCKVTSHFGARAIAVFIFAAELPEKWAPFYFAKMGTVALETSLRHAIEPIFGPGAQRMVLEKYKDLICAAPPAALFSALAKSLA